MSGGNIIHMNAYRRLISANNSPTITAAEGRTVDNPATAPHDTEAHSQGANMSDTTVNKDWAERRLSEVDGKIELEKTKSELKFDRLFREMQLEHKATIAHVDARFAQIDTQIARSETNQTRWFIGILLSIVGLTVTVYFKTREADQPPPVVQTIYRTAPATKESPQTPSNPAPPAAKP